MTFEELRNFIFTDPRFKVFSDPHKEDLLRKIDRIMDSPKIKDQSKQFLDNQMDLQRYVKIAKNVAGLTTVVKNRKGSLQDPNLITNPRDPDDDTAKNIIIDDLKAFYYELDTITKGKHDFVTKIDELLSKTTFLQGERSSVGATYDNNGNIVESHINIETEAIVNNRTVAPHEMWHAMDEQNYALNTKPKLDQFIGEIGSMFIDELSRDYIVNTYSKDKQLVEDIKYIGAKDNKLDYMVIKAKQSYAEYLIAQIVAGTPEEREKATNELFDNVGKLWDVRDINQRINQLFDIANDPKKRFDPMYELRYVVGYAVADAVYNMDLPLEDKIDKMVEFNNNIVSIDNLGENGQKPLDIVTDHFGLDKIEDLIDEQYSDRTMSKKSKKQQGKSKEVKVREKDSLVMIRTK